MRGKVEKMNIALIHAHFNADHLALVKAQMADLGAPVIKAVWMDCHGHWAALEGSHRIRAAAELGLTPVIEEVEYSEDTTLESLGCDDAGEGYTVAQIADDSHRTEVLAFAA